MGHEQNAGPHGVALLSGVSGLAGSYDGVLCDVWGVLHNGVRAFPQACAALEGLRQAGAAVVLLTNAPRPNGAVRRQLGALGVPDTAYDRVVTSGDLAQDMLRRHAGEGVYHLGPERDLPVFEGLETTFVGPDAAALIVNTGLFDDTTESPDDYRELLSGLAARSVEMVCANPDIVVERGDKLVWCAGSLAELYAALGGPVVWAGKPHRPIYERALREIEAVTGSPVSADRVLAIGDSLRTDLAGAAAMGFDAIFVAEGIHGHQTGRGENVDPKVLEDMFAEAGVRPRAVMAQLDW